MLRVGAAAMALAAVALLLGCGGSGSAPDAPPSLADRLEGDDGENVGLIFGTSDFAVGRNRVTFLVVGSDGRVVQAPRARVLVRRGDLEGPPASETHAELVPLGPHSHPEGAPPHDHPDAQDLYAAHLRFARPGRYWLVVEPDGDEGVEGYGVVRVRRRSLSPPLGSRAVASDNPTLADAPAELITTARPPDRALLRHSIEDSLAAQSPFVAVFATPAYCTSRTCGPTVEVVDAVRRRNAGRGVRFIHVEVYTGNDPARGYNRWFKEWRLPTEPWVFLVDGRGVIRAKFEGSVSVDELDGAVRRTLLP